MLAEVASNESVRERIVKKMSDQDANIFTNYLTSEKLAAFDMTEQDIQLFTDILDRITPI